MKKGLPGLNKGSFCKDICTFHMTDLQVFWWLSHFRSPRGIEERCNAFVKTKKLT